MSSKTDDSQNIWFGFSMFLLGLISGSVLTIAFGGASFSGTPPTVPSAPSAQELPPKTSVYDRMLDYAVAAGVSASDFETCMTDRADEFTAYVNTMMAEGQAAGVKGTPGNVLYDIASKKGRVVSGARPFAAFKTHIDEMLADPATPITDNTVTATTTVAPINFERDHIFGDRNAPLAIIEYSDFECPYCHSVHPTYKQIMEEYDGNVMWVFRHFPLDFHQEAMPLAIGSECVASLKGNDAFWSFTDAVMSE